MPGEQEHKCKYEEIVFSNKPTGEPDGDSVSFPGRCRHCGKEFEEVYRRNPGLWDVAAQEYVEVPK